MDGAFRVAGIGLLYIRGELRRAPTPFIPVNGIGIINIVQKDRVLHARRRDVYVTVLQYCVYKWEFYENAFGITR